MIAFDKVPPVLQAHTPALIDAQDTDARAAVAMIVDSAQSNHDPSVLFIERAHNPDDPWSGHMAFPGGRCEPLSEPVIDTARRETGEEIGLYLPEASVIGRLDDMQGRHAGRSAGLVISCLVFSVASEEDLTLNHEVANTVKVPFSALLDGRNQTHIEYPNSGAARYPAVRIRATDPRLVWGLTYRFLRSFFGLLGHHLPES
ncbi:MAG: CoA pyrophosphatase [Pseudomonadota bacterium]|nr:CoA pyrophosphatase [Pseudomonadota bacterium]